jgi:hypothetical protein
MTVRRTEISEAEFRACEDGAAMRALEAKRLLLNGFRGNWEIHSRYDAVHEVWLYWQKR